MNQMNIMSALNDLVRVDAITGDRARELARLYQRTGDPNEVVMELYASDIDPAAIAEIQEAAEKIIAN